MPRTSGWKSASACGAGRPGERDRGQVLLLSASASWGATCRAPSVSGGGVGWARRATGWPAGATGGDQRQHEQRLLFCAPLYPAIRRWPDEDLRAAARPAGGPARRRRRRARLDRGVGGRRLRRRRRGRRAGRARRARRRGPRATSRASSATRRPRPRRSRGWGTSSGDRSTRRRGSLGDLVATADRQVAIIERLATVMGWLVFLIPVTTVLARLAAAAGPLRPPRAGGAALHRRAGRPRPVRAAGHGQPADARARRDQRRPGRCVARPATVG